MFLNLKKFNIFVKTKSRIMYLNLFKSLYNFNKITRKLSKIKLYTKKFVYKPRCRLTYKSSEKYITNKFNTMPGIYTNSRLPLHELIYLHDLLAYIIKRNSNEIRKIKHKFMRLRLGYFCETIEKDITRIKHRFVKKRQLIMKGHMKNIKNYFARYLGHSNDSKIDPINKKMLENQFKPLNEIIQKSRKMYMMAYKKKKLIQVKKSFKQYLIKKKRKNEVECILLLRNMRNLIKQYVNNPYNTILIKMKLF
jgi:hypothetical protein